MVRRLRARCEPNRHRADRLGHPREQIRQLVVALDRDRRAVERRDRSLRVGERNERVERADLGAGRHRGSEDGRVERSARVGHRLAAVHPEPAGNGRDRVVRVRRRGSARPRPASAVASANPRLPSTRSVNRPRRTGSRLATARTGQPARWSATPSAVPTAPAPTIPMTGGSAPSVRTCGCGWSCAWTSSPWRWWPGGSGSRSTPAASSSSIVLVARVVALARALRLALRIAPGLHRPPIRAGRLARYSSTRRVYRPPSGGRVARDDQLADPFDARASLGSGLPDYFRLSAVGDRLDLARAPVTLKILLENALRHAGHGIVRADEVETLASWRPGQSGRGRDPVHAGPGDPAGLHRRPGGRRPRGHARRDGRSRRRPGEGQSPRPGRPRHRPLGPGRPVRHVGGVRLQRRSRVRAERRALPAVALGPDRVPRLPGRAARDRHRPPGQPRVPRDGRDRCPGPVGRIGPDRLPGHARRDRLPHDDDQCARRARLRRRGDRGRGGPARPAALPADAADRRRPAPRRAAAGLHGDRPRARRDRDAPLVRRGRRVRRVRRRRAGGPVARRPGDDQQHEPRVRGDIDDLPDRRRDVRRTCG